MNGSAESRPHDRMRRGWMRMTSRLKFGIGGSASTNASAWPRTSTPRTCHGSTDAMSSMTSATLRLASTLRNLRVWPIRYPPMSIVPSSALTKEGHRVVLRASVGADRREAAESLGGQILAFGFGEEHAPSLLLEERVALDRTPALAGHAGRRTRKAARLNGRAYLPSRLPNIARIAATTSRVPSTAPTTLIPGTVQAGAATTTMSSTVPSSPLTSRRASGV